MTCQGHTPGKPELDRESNGSATNVYPSTTAMVLKFHQTLAKPATGSVGTTAK